MVSDSTLQLVFKKLPLAGVWGVVPEKDATAGQTENPPPFPKETPV